MIRKTFFERLETLIKSMVWTGTTTKIFGLNVYVVPYLPASLLGRIVAPTCFIVEAGIKHHTEHPNIVEQDINIEVFIENISSEFGRGSVMSGNRTANSSVGVGIIDLEKEFKTQVINTITLTDSVQIIETSSQKASIVSGNNPLLWRVMTYNVMLEL